GRRPLVEGECEAARLGIRSRCFLFGGSAASLPPSHEGPDRHMSRTTPDQLAGFQADLTAIRRDIHRHPETAFEERRTAQIVADKLTSWGIYVPLGLSTTALARPLHTYTHDPH